MNAAAGERKSAERSSHMWHDEWLGPVFLSFFPGKEDWSWDGLSCLYLSRTTCSYTACRIIVRFLSVYR